MHLDVDTGRYSTSNGSTDISNCLPCPEGRVCGEQGMFNLSLSTRCPEGHICGVGTDRSTMFTHKCPAGTYCGWETLPADQYNFACDRGYFCTRGTTEQMRKRDRCAVGYYCPDATADVNHPEIRCPYFTTTTSSFGQSRVTDCIVETQHICDKRAASEFDPFEEASYYNFLNYTILDGSGQDKVIGGDGVGEVSVVGKVMPVNVTAVAPNYTAPNWRNETVEVFRTCPDYVREKAKSEVVVIGRNFYESSLLMCRFTACRFTTDAIGRRDPRSCAVPDRHLTSGEAPLRDVAGRSIEVPASVQETPRNVDVFRTLEASISVDFQPIRLLLGPLIISARDLEIETQPSLASTRIKSR